MRVSWLAVLLIGCAQSPPRGDLPEGAPTEGTRVRLPSVTFDGTWGDWVTLEAALDPDCRFMEPLFDDWSTSWPPLQVYWVIHDQPKDVEDGDRIEDTFFVGDLVVASDYPPREGQDALGFKFLPPLQQSFVNIESTEVRDEGRELRAVLGNPIDALLGIRAVQPDCTITSSWCALPCDEPDQPLSRIDIRLGPLWSPQEVTFYP